MPYVDNNGVKIHYEVFGDGPPVVLCHGLFGSVKSWRDRGWIDRLAPEFQLVIPEIRAHGKSDTPRDPAQYSLEHRMSDVIAVMEDSGTEIAGYFGYSMGAAMGFGLAGLAPHRFNSLVLGGAHPYPKDLSWVRNITRQHVLDGNVAGHNDPAPYLAVLDADESGTGVTPESITLPCFIFGGGADPHIKDINRTGRLIPNSEYVELDGLGHGEALDASDELTPAVLRFLRTHA